MANKTIHCFVSGQVQGVFFRAGAQAKAEECGITGWVRNCIDGTVELMASGDENHIEIFHEWLAEGTEDAFVEDVQCDEIEEQDFDGFQIQD